MSQKSTLELLSLEAREVPAAPGTLDPTFGTSGRVTVSFNLGGTNLDEAQAVAVQPNGNIVVAGSIAFTGGSYFAAVRLLPNGTIDPSFGGSGKAIVAFGGSGVNAGAVAVAIQKDGKIVLGGTTDGANTDLAVTRLNADGSLDAGFGNGGKAVIAFDRTGANEDLLKDLTIQSDGKIVVVGSAESANGSDGVVVRLTENGALDTTFNTTGFQFVPFDQGSANNDILNAVAIQADGRIVAVGSAETPGGTDIALTRLNADGTVDTSFDTDGKLAYSVNLGGSNNDVANDVQIQSTGKVVVIGSASALGRSEMVALRLESSGALDTSFGTKGITTINLNGSGSNLAQGNSLGVMSDDKLVMVGTLLPGTNADMALVRLEANGAIDTKFGTGGLSLVGFNKGGRNNDSGYATAIQTDGRIVVVGVAETGGTNLLGDMAIARLSGVTPPPQPLLAGGLANGTARILAPGSGQYITSDTLTFFNNTTTIARTATADVNGDNVPDFIAVSGPGGVSRLAVIDGATKAITTDFVVFEAAFTGGMYVAAADVNSDGRADVIVSPDQGGGPIVAVYDGAKLAAGVTGEAAQMHRYFGIDDPAFRGGARPAAADVTGDGVPDVVVAAGFGGGPRVTIWDGVSVASKAPRQLDNFFVFEQTLRNGAFVTAGDVNGDGIAELAFGGGPGGAPRVRIWDVKGAIGSPRTAALDPNFVLGNQLANFFAGDANSRGGARVMLNDVNGDGKSDIAVGSGTGDPARVRLYRSETLLTNANPQPNQDFDPFSQPVTTGVFVG
ncbi:MAG: FG-GAP-like repeat-containing protein [Fimbriiglobus sp.]